MSRRPRRPFACLVAGCAAVASMVVLSPSAAAAPQDGPTVFREAMAVVDQARAVAPVRGAVGATAGLGSWERPVRPVRTVDLERYLGTWLQLAAIPTFFSAPCARDTTAAYALLADGEVDVTNTCTGFDGQPVVAEGQARVVGPRPSQLEVTFAFTPAGDPIYQAAGDYWIIGLDQRDYQWAVVGAPDRESLFVLSREPVLTPRQATRVLFSILRSGYDPCDLVLTATTGGIEQDVPLCGR